MCTKITSKEQLLTVYDNVKELIEKRTILQEKPEKYHISVCGGTGCMSSKSEEIVKSLKHWAKEYGVEDKVEVAITGCFGFCERGPIVKIFPDHTFYTKVTVEETERIIRRHICSHDVINHLLYKNNNGERVFTQENIDFYKKQNRIALRNCGLINPEEIAESIAAKGYQALATALFDMTQDQVIEVVTASGLRGRGGAGFPTGLKWKFAKNAKSKKKYVICNADEGDPGAFMDRSILEGDPHSVLESMAICGYAIGADEGYIYIRAEYPLAIKRLRIAIKQATEMGLLGNNIMGTGFNFNIKIKYGAGAFVCGEETALIHSIEGKRGEPTLKPPFPAEKGLYGKPTNVNNVETWANIPYILLNGASNFASIGTEKSTGTKVFALAGKINNGGLVEVPMGITLREIIYDIGGGIPNGKKFKAVQTGGPSGGCLSEKDLDTPVDYDSLVAKGSMMGSGGMIVLDEDDCMVNIAKFYLEFTVEESCGKCTPCRIGNMRMLEILNRITEGNGTMHDLFELENLATTIQSSALCALGQSAPNPVLSTLKEFRDEYVAHIVDKKCPAGSCRNLINYEIVTDLCLGCGLCARNCPTNAIYRTDKTGANARLNAYAINPDKCVKCGACVSKCPAKPKAIKK